MQSIPRVMLERFAQEFAYADKGFALKEITPYFEAFQTGIPAPGFDGILPRKADHFVLVLSALSPRNQRLALFELCCNPPKIKCCPSEETRKQLLATLIQSDGTTPLSLDLSKVSLAGIREQWWDTTSRLTNSPASAITAARSMLESTCKTIITERNEVPSMSGDIQQLFNQTRGCLGLKTGATIPRPVNEILSGLLSVTNGLAAISNEAGDRHGMIAGEKIENTTIASLCIHSAGVIALFLAQMHLELKYPIK